MDSPIKHRLFNGLSAVFGVSSIGVLLSRLNSRLRNARTLEMVRAISYVFRLKFHLFDEKCLANTILIFWTTSILGYLSMSGVATPSSAGYLALLRQLTAHRRSLWRLGVLNFQLSLKNKILKLEIYITPNAFRLLHLFNGVFLVFWKTVWF